MKLFNQLLVVFISLFAVTFVFIGSLTYIGVRDVINNQIIEQLVSIADIKKNQMNLVIDSYLGLVRSIASHSHLYFDLEKYNQTPVANLADSINEEIMDAKNASDKIISISIVDASGQLVTSTEDNHQLRLVASRTEAAIEDIFLDENNIPRVLLSSPIKINNTTIGFVEMISKIDWLSSIASDYSGLGKSGEVLVAKKNEAGDAIFITPIRFDAQAALHRVVAKEKTNIPSVWAVNGVEKSFMTGMVDYRHVPVLAVTRFIASQGWGIVVKIDRVEVFKPLVNILLIFIVIITITFIAIILVVVLISRIITKPIIQLAQAAKRVAQRDFTTTTTTTTMNYHTNNEIGDLVVAFDKMTNKLKTSYQNLETKIQDRTHDMEKFQLAVDNASEQIIITDPDGIILYANRALEKITGFKIKEVLGKKAGAKELWGGKMDKKFYEKMWQTIKIDKKNFTGELTNRRKDGTDYSVLVSISLVFNKKGEIIYLVGVERDITREKEINKMKTEFVSVASHQLRTPLTAIRWYVEEIYHEELGKLNSEQKDYLKQVLESNDRMIRLVNDLLNVSRLESGRVTVEPVLTNLVELIDGVISARTSEELAPRLNRARSN